MRHLRLARRQRRGNFFLFLCEFVFLLGHVLLDDFFGGFPALTLSHCN